MVGLSFIFSRNSKESLFSTIVLSFIFDPDIELSEISEISNDEPFEISIDSHVLFTLYNILGFFISIPLK